MSRVHRIAAVLFALCGASAAFARQANSDRAQSCKVCHGGEAREFAQGIHAKSSVDCITCHGGAAGEVDVAKAHGANLKKLGDPLAAVESCVGCHSDVEQMRSFGLRTDQLSLYWTSRHGAKLALDGDPNVATCVSCHGSHFVLPVRDPLSPVHERHQVDTCGRCHADATLMAKYGLPADVVQDFRGSVHGKALIEGEHPAAPGCTECHGSHGAAPPRTGDVRQVCGNCHSVVQEYFERSPHVAGAHDKGLQCTSCHDHHAVVAPSTEMFTGSDEGHCGNCHSGDNDPALAIGVRLRDDVERLAATIRGVDEEIGGAARRGLFLGEERGYLEDARGLLVRARTMTHTASPVALDEILNRGQAMVEKTLESLTTKNRIFRDRKIYTAILFVVAVCFAIALSMYGRAISGRWKAAQAPPEGDAHGR